MSGEATTLYKKVAEKTSRKTGQKYSDVMAFVRRRVRFDLLRTCLISIRGHRGNPLEKEAASIEELDLNLTKQTDQC